MISDNMRNKVIQTVNKRTIRRSNRRIRTKHTDGMKEKENQNEPRQYQPPWSIYESI